MSDIAFKLPHNPDLIHDWPAIDAAISRMAVEITADLAGERPIFMTVLTGGLLIGGCLAHRIQLDLVFDYVHATRYRGTTEGGTLHWIAKPRSSLKNQVVILVDDILDEGYTLDALRQHCFDEGAREVRIAVLTLKRHNRRVPGLKADYIGLDVPDRYVFGFGMDYRELGRNLPGIYALKDS
jgi:hypoxanthine phosphoribosyltransferase